MVNVSFIAIAFRALADLYLPTPPKWHIHSFIEEEGCYHGVVLVVLS
jgi:hypothetical protein